MNNVVVGSLIGSVFISLVAMIAAVIVYGIVQVSTEAACLRAGWPKASIAWDLGRYCVKRVDQTDQVKPLSQIKTGRE